MILHYVPEIPDCILKMPVWEYFVVIFGSYLFIIK